MPSDLCLALAPHADQPEVFEALVDVAVRSEDPYLHTVVLAGAGRAGRPTPLTAALWLSETPAPLELLERSAEVAGRRGGGAGDDGDGGRFGPRRPHRFR